MKKGQHLKAGEKHYFNQSVNSNTDPQSLEKYAERFFKSEKSQMKAKCIVRNKKK